MIITGPLLHIIRHEKLGNVKESNDFVCELKNT